MERTLPIEIRNFLPHRAPMLMVDLITDISQDSVTTTFLVPKDCIFVDNGFFSESGLIENAAQTCSAIVAQNFFIETEEPVKLVGFIGGIKKLAIKSLPLVGQKLISKATLISKMDSGDFVLCLIQCTIFAEEKIVLETQMNLFITKQSDESRSSTSRR